MYFSRLRSSISWYILPESWLDSLFIARPSWPISPGACSLARVFMEPSAIFTAASRSALSGFTMPSVSLLISGQSAAQLPITSASTQSTTTAHPGRAVSANMSPTPSASAAPASTDASPQSITRFFSTLLFNILRVYLKPVAHAVHCLERPRHILCGQLLTDALDMCVHRAGVAEVIVAPYPGKYLLPAEHLAHV